jgi:TetR/AcrR family transcriptional regulator, lmrAB and yxaGH operons repressor
MSVRASAIPALAEAFRRYGYEGASLAALTEATGLGKGSLYNFFPGGKDEMAAAVLEDVSAWFEANIFAPLRTPAPPNEGVDQMFDAVVDYFHSGQRICLQGAFALGHERDRFSAAVQHYFERWIDALTNALRASGLDDQEARIIAIDTVSQIQGAIVLARALDNSAIFVDIVNRVRESLGIVTRQAEPR